MELKEVHCFFDSIISFPCVALLGMGREGMSSYKFLRKLYPDLNITVADRNKDIDRAPEFKSDSNISFLLGDSYMEDIEKAVEENKFAIILKTPGISLKSYPNLLANPILSSQADLFLRFWGRQCIGITGTKGKSTTTHLIYHLLKDDFNCILAGNMGIPFFDIILSVKSHTKIICELSSHQLQQVTHAPEIGVLLNLYEEHLDHYNSFEEYQYSKMNISGGKVFVWNIEDTLIYERLLEKLESDAKQANSMALFSRSKDALKKISKKYVDQAEDILYEENSKILSWKEGLIYDLKQPHPLVGKHNEFNLMAALLAGRLVGGDYFAMAKRIHDFTPLPHRLEYIGQYDGIHFFNDSISTIAQACVAAIESIRDLPYVSEVGSLILGGFDRGIDYSFIIDYLCSKPVRCIAFTGKAGERICEGLENKKALPKCYIQSDDYAQIVKWVKKNTRTREACLLSPAAASYDSFKNFEERGEVFTSLVKKL